MSHWQKVKHLHYRAGFGPDLALWQHQRFTPIPELVNCLFENSHSVEHLVVGDAPDLPASRAEMMGLSEEERRMLRKQGRDSQKKLNASWVERMATTQAQLREKMTLFWHDHFACYLPAQYFIVLQQHNLIRKYALGKFGDLLHAVSKDAGMLRFLNNQQNRKDHPNENFAREVMELFTLGRGHYTEQDIQEAARAFTGWSSNMRGEYLFRKQWHDYGSKTFLGRTGNFNGEDILDILLEEKQTARYLTEKIYRYFVNAKPDAGMIEKWADQFYRSEYDISQLLRTIFLSDHFYEANNVGNRIKSPIEYLVSIMRLLGVSFPDKDGPLFIQKVLGQVLFHPPNVAGWPDGRSWIDSSSLMARMKIPQAIILASGFDLKAKAGFAGNEDSFQFNRAETRNQMVRKLKGDITWSKLTPVFSQNGQPHFEHLQQYLLQKTPRWNAQDLAPFTRANDLPQNLKLTSMRMLCTPEFQLC